MTMTRTQPRTASEIVTDGSLGVFTVIALILLLWGALWLRDNSHLHPPRYISVYFRDTAQLSDSANVFIDGVRVGDVDKLQWQSEHRVLVQLKITNHLVKLPVGSRFCILNNGIVGAKYVEIVAPDHKPNDPEPQEMANNAIVEGEDPVRPELALNNLVVGLSRIDTDKLAKNFDSDRFRLCRAADQLAALADKSMPLVDAAMPLAHDLHALTNETTVATHHLNTFLDHPKFSQDVKDTVQMAKSTVETIKSTMDELNVTLNDKDLRGDLITALKSLHQATENLERTVGQVQQITGDQQLRTDVKEILARANEGLTKVDKLFKEPGYGTDLKQTLSSTRDAVDHIDLAARQLNQILDKRSPIIHLLVGRPGLIKEVERTKEVQKAKATKADKAPKADSAGSGSGKTKDVNAGQDNDDDKQNSKNVFGKPSESTKTAPSP
jgi:ABC-type transporter Mla subunit MlaD